MSTIKIGKSSAAECRAVEGHGNDPGSLPKRERGLYGKFRVERRDGTDQPGLKHDGCKYFVLDMTHDPFAKPALEAYANACGAEYPALAADLLRAVRQDALGELVRVGHERDEARRLYAESEATSQGERLGAPASTSDEAPNSEVTGGGIAAASPAPIPLGAVVESVEYAYRFARYTHDWECMQGDPPVGHPVDVEVSALCTALYRALHPVADAATVERVAMAIWNVQTAEHNAWDAITERTRNTLRAEARATLRALGYTIQEGA